MYSDPLLQQSENYNGWKDLENISRKENHLIRINLIVSQTESLRQIPLKTKVLNYNF